MANVKLKFNYEAPRWAKTEGFIKQLALWHGLDCKVSVTKGWIRESGTVVCEGEEAEVRHFKLKLGLAMSAYNGS